MNVMAFIIWAMKYKISMYFAFPFMIAHKGDFISIVYVMRI